MRPFLMSHLEPSLARELDHWVDTLKAQKIDDENRKLRGEVKPIENPSFEVSIINI